MERYSVWIYYHWKILQKHIRSGCSWKSRIPEVIQKQIMLWSVICRRHRNLTIPARCGNMWRKKYPRVHSGIWKVRQRVCSGHWGLSCWNRKSRSSPAVSANVWRWQRFWCSPVTSLCWMSRRTTWITRWQRGWRTIWSAGGAAWSWWRMTGIFWTVFPTGSWRSTKERSTAMIPIIPDFWSWKPRERRWKLLRSGSVSRFSGWN